MPTIAVHGAAGRMGRRLLALVLEDDSLSLAAALERPGHDLAGQDAGVICGLGPCGVVIADAVPQSVDALIDFTTPAATHAVLAKCVASECAMVIGTTGLNDDDHAAIDEAAGKIAILQAPNMSLGVNLLFALAARAASQLGDAYDIEIVEAHHRFKVDAPSGTALGIAEAICRATGRDPNKVVSYDRHGDDVPRQKGQIGMHALRLGDVVGRHTVSFATLGEELQLTHLAGTRDVFARGALAGATWLAGKPAGRYSMADVLGLAELE